ncbi:MAG: AEC family transporter [Campylobacterota bacterium]|nr:AEC family transporter [Campylobacterota bacterium]
MELFLSIFILMALGYMFNKFKIFPEQTPLVLNLYIIYVSLPAMVLLHVPKIVLSLDMFFPIVIPWVITLLGALSILALSNIFHWNKQTTGALLLVGVLGNTSFLGIPIVEFYLGTHALPYVMIYDQLGTFLALSTYGGIVIALYSKNGKVHARTILIKIFTFPPFMALIVAFALSGYTFYPSINTVLSNLANTLVPVALVAVGFSLRLKIPKEDLSAFISGLGVKLILLPSFAFIIAGVFNLEGLAVDVSILESGMGPMITAGAVATIAGLSARLCSAIIGYGILFSFLSTYVVAYFL